MHGKHVLITVYPFNANLLQLQADNCQLFRGLYSPTSRRLVSVSATKTSLHEIYKIAMATCLHH